jgi:dihydrodipicolinate synthase/N-acetylneuraminate lyase
MFLHTMTVTQKTRKTLLNKAFPSGIPGLWCPLLTHYTSKGEIDVDRMDAHMGHISTWVKGYLIPGSTGDGWELNHDETSLLVDFALQQAGKYSLKVLLGVLKPSVEEMWGAIRSMLQKVRGFSGIDDPIESLFTANICGFTVCPPTGESLTQEIISQGLSVILDMGLPIALYQLPQVTGNEIAPETFVYLAESYPNLIFFKDTSGADRIATSGMDTGGTFLVRGAEGDYARWLKPAGGPYDGFLLSTANSFPSFLSTIIELIDNGDIERARALSDKITHAMDRVFALIHSVPQGNMFTNANKAIDHYMAYGPSASKKQGPMLHAGVRLPESIIAETGKILTHFDLMPQEGYS